MQTVNLLNVGPSEQAELRRIAQVYATALHEKWSDRHDGKVKEFHLDFAADVLSKNAYGLSHLANGLNEVGKATFAAVTGVNLPKGQNATWCALRAWAGITDAQDALVNARRKVEIELKCLGYKVNNVETVHQWVREQVAAGYDRLVNEDARWYLANSTGRAHDLSIRGTRLTCARPLIQAEIALANAQKAVNAEQQATSKEPAADETPLSNPPQSLLSCTATQGG